MRIPKSVELGIIATLVAVAAGCGSSTPTNPPAPPPPPPPSAVVASIAVTGPSATMSPGSTQAMSGVAKNAAGQTVAATMTWNSSVMSVATIDASGMVTAVTAGVTNITAASGGVTSNSVAVTVAVVAGPVGSIVVDKASVLLPATGRSAQLTAQIFDPQGAPTGGTVTWTSSAPDKVSVSAAGALLANAIGSAQILAEAGGVRSAPTLVFVAEPKAGALLLTDAQIVSVGPPLGLGVGEVPGVWTQFEVTVTGVTAPSVGTVVLGAETAPVAGKVVGSRQDPAGLIVTLAVAPLYQLFGAYNSTITLDLSKFPVEDLPAPSVQSLRSARPSLSAVWNAGRRDRKHGGVTAAPAFSPLAPFQAFSCDASIKPQLLGTPISLSLDNKLTLVLDDRPGYSKHALEGSAALVGSAGLKLKAGFKGSGKCEAQAQIKLPIFGWFSVLAMPAVRFGLGAALDGEVVLVQGELGVEGTVGFSPSLGWECGGVTPACRGLNDITPLNQFKTKSDFPAQHGMQAKVSAQFYLLAGLDAAILGGVLNAGILEARVGPKQSFDLAFEEDQAARTNYAASYDLKIDGVVEPGPALKKAIEAVINDDAVGVNLSLTFSSDISESPKGSLAASKTLVRPGAAVDFTVDLTPSTLAYFLLNYNVSGVELYRKREDEAEFTDWKSMSLIASNRATYKWTPVEAEAGKYEIAAFVNTKIPTPLLEVGPNSIVPVEVSCFSGGPSASASQAPATCADVWTGAASYTIKTPGVPGADIVGTSNITWTYDATKSFPGIISYTATGIFDVAIHTPEPGCTITLSPNHFTIVPSLLTPSTLSIFDNGLTPPNYGFGASQLVNMTSTASCPGKPDVVSALNGFLVNFAFGTGPFAAGQASLIGSTDDGAVATTWDFRRP